MTDETTITTTPGGRLNEADRRALLERWVRGEALDSLATEVGRAPATLRVWAHDLGIRKRERLDAVRPARLPGGGGRRNYVIVGPETWAEIRTAFLGGVSAKKLSAAYGPSVTNIFRRAGKEGWRKKDVQAPPLPWAETPLGRALRAGNAEDEPAADPARFAAVLHAHQRPPEGRDWSTWLLLAGRGAGKTFAGASWLCDLAEGTDGVRLALVGPTLHDVREVMIEGRSGIRGLPRYAAGSGRAAPVYEPSRRRLLWENGSRAYAFSADDPESLRGPQHHGAWADELCAWKRPGETLALLRMGLRLGTAPKLVVTTTPKPLPALRRLVGETGCATVRAASRDNAKWLSPDFLERLEALYGGTRLAAQELEGLIVEDDALALWTAETLARCRGARPPVLDRVVVAVDPPATAGGNPCGIVVAGRRERTAYVLADRTASGLTPFGWAARVVAAAAEFNASAVVAEVNQGGDMVRHVLASAGIDRPLRLVRATEGKRVRAEPVAALYEQGRVVHCGAFPALEEELMGLGSDAADPFAGTGGRSDDRADALVWAVTDLLLGPVSLGPRIRVL